MCTFIIILVRLCLPAWGYVGPLLTDRWRGHSALLLSNYRHCNRLRLAVHNQEILTLCRAQAVAYFLDPTRMATPSYINRFLDILRAPVGAPLLAQVLVLLFSALCSVVLQAVHCNYKLLFACLFGSARAWLYSCARFYLIEEPQHLLMPHRWLPRTTSSRRCSTCARRSSPPRTARRLPRRPRRCVCSNTCGDSPARWAGLQNVLDWQYGGDRELLGIACDVFCPAPIGTCRLH